MPEFLIIGGVSAGTSAAARARRLSPDLKITILEKSADISYRACGIPAAMAEPDPDLESLIVRPAAAFAQDQVLIRFEHEAVGIDPDRGRVHCVAGGRDVVLSYDHLLLTMGALPVRPEVPGVDLPGVEVLRSLGDARVLRTYCREGVLSRVTVVGAGYVGVAMAEALARRGLDVTLIEERDAILPGVESVIAHKVVKAVRKQGVRVLLGAALAGIERESQSARHLVVETEEGTKFSTDLVLLATGVRPNVDFAKEAGVELGETGAIAVDALQRTNIDGILAAGDCAEAYHRIVERAAWVPLCTTAIKQGRVAGSVVAGEADYFHGVVGTMAAEVCGTQVARTGLTMSEAKSAGFDPVMAVTSAPSRAPGRPEGRSLNMAIIADRKEGRLIGAHCCGQDGAVLRINTFAAALHAELAAEDVATIDLAYTPSAAPVWDPILVGASLAARKIVEPPRAPRARLPRVAGSR